MVIMYLIEVNDLSFAYEGSCEPAIKDINFRLKEGEILAIVGGKESGKTTLCQAINGLIPHYHEGEYNGSVKINGVDLREVSFDELSKKVGYLFQEPSDQLIGRTVEEDVSFGAINQGFGKDVVAKRVGESLSLTNLEGYEERDVDKLSGGETKKLALAGLLATGNEILVMDEPTRELDPEERKNLVEVIKDLRERGKTIIYSTKKIELIEHSDKLLLLDNGDIVDKKQTDRLCYDLNKLMDLGLRPNQKHRTLSYICSKDGEKRGIDFLSDFEIALRELNDMKTDFSFSSFGDRGSGKKRVIEVSGLEYSYNSKRVLDGVHLDVYESEYLGLAGSNGSGKTTFAKLLAGLLDPDKGVIRYNTQDIGELGQEELSKRIGYVFQNPDDQIFNRTVEDEVIFSLRRRKDIEEDVQEKSESLLREFNLYQVKEEFPFNLCFSERKRLVTAAIAAMDPRVIVLDEPFSGLDQNEKENIEEILIELKRKGKTIVHISHDLGYLAKRCDRLAVFNNGKIDLKEDIRETFGDEELLSDSNLKQPFAPKLSSSIGTKEIILTTKEIKKSINL
ncbi:MAG: ABC-type glutathione transport system ATPase component with duplicated ATPase domain [Candidatus Methanohalarchaeum thermophilum]|uniref:ABC-type glutathione transport system ATPase component with duplicated ATPase domain n=1 Tax=Methanohalarchaeum thermophilum TaxID=1903181 RepID=A0A1Q6DSZ5_METT1|nr:MAG: ABC-type glutathione transport system ATPase component with duplicated ATPase domain [Candidatus Methanohalarchaeum thermophilum]